MKLLAGTNSTLQSAAILLLRLAVGGILFIAGAGKVLGWFGGMGMDATIQGYVNQAGIPLPLAYTSIYAELFGGILLAAGLLTRPAALVLAVNMLVAGILTIPMGFMAVAAYPFSLMVSSVSILLAGPMRYSIDALLEARTGGRREAAT